MSRLLAARDRQPGHSRGLRPACPGSWAQPRRRGCCVRRQEGHQVAGGTEATRWAPWVPAVAASRRPRSGEARRPSESASPLSLHRDQASLRHPSRLRRSRRSPRRVPGTSRCERGGPGAAARARTRAPSGSGRRRAGPTPTRRPVRRPCHWVDSGRARDPPRTRLVGRASAA